MEMIAKIRAEIERLKGIGGIVPLDNREQKTGYESALIDIETFLDTLEEEPVDVSRDENIGLSIMFFLGTHVKHENSVLVRGKGEVTYKEACEWIRRNIAREKSEKPMNQDDELNDEIKKFIDEYGYERGADKLLIAIVARHFAQWGAEHLKK